MSIKWAPASEEELARRNVGVKTKMVRARDEKGAFKADDPSTPDVNEAWVKKVVRKTTKSASKKKG